MRTKKSPRRLSWEEFRSQFNEKFYDGQGVPIEVQVVLRDVWKALRA